MSTFCTRYPNVKYIDVVNEPPPHTTPSYMNGSGGSGEKAGAPIDAIGAQAHDAYKLPTATVKGYIDKLAATGLPVYITEYDIDIADDNQQKNVMQEQFTMFYTSPNVRGITFWGYIVGATWRSNTGLQQSSGAMRPAMTWLMQYLDRPTN